MGLTEDDLETMRDLAIQVTDDLDDLGDLETMRGAGHPGPIRDYS